MIIKYNLNNLRRFERALIFKDKPNYIRTVLASTQMSALVIVFGHKMTHY